MRGDGEEVTTLAKRNLAGGELSPSLYARVDNARYAVSVKTMRNNVVKREGGSENRAGTYYIARSFGGRPLPFYYGDSEILLEIGSVMRWYVNGVQAREATKAITGISKASPGVVTAVGHGYSNFDEVHISGVLGMTELNGRNFKVNVLTIDTFSLLEFDAITPFSTAAYTTYVSGGTCAKVRQIATPFAGALQFLRGSQPEAGAPMDLTHPLFPPQTLTYNGTTFTIGNTTFAPSISAPVMAALAGAGVVEYVATAVDALTGEESLAGTPTDGGTAPTSGTPQTVTWGAVTGASYYRVYRRDPTVGSVFGYIGDAAGPTYTDYGSIPLGEEFLGDKETPRPPVNRSPFGSAGNYPAIVVHYQQRKMFFQTANERKGIFGSRVGSLNNFVVGNPVSPDDSVKFNEKGRGKAITNAVALERLILWTDKSVISMNGDDTGAITPTSPGLKVTPVWGADPIPPLVVDGSAIFVAWAGNLPGSGNIIRDLAFTQEGDGYRGNDLTAFARHLFKGHKIVSWDYQQSPDSIIWAAREDGALLGLTYLKEHQIAGWHRHDTDGDFRQALCLNRYLFQLGYTTGGISYPSAEVMSPDEMYFQVEREINGETVTYLERMTPRNFTDIKVDAIFMDSAITYDGRNTAAHYMHLSGGTGTWDEQDLTLISSLDYFSATEVGNEIWLLKEDGNYHRFTITAYTNAKTVTVQSMDGDVDEELRVQADILAVLDGVTGQIQFSGPHGLEDGDIIYIAGVGGRVDVNGNHYVCYVVDDDTITIKTLGFLDVDTTAMPAYTTGGTVYRTTLNWSRAVDRVTGAWHLEGKNVSVLGDGTVVASPNNFRLDDEGTPEYTYPLLTVTNGAIDLEQCYAVIHVGLPKMDDIETLDIDTASSETLSDKKMLVNEVTLHLQDTRGVFIGSKAPEDSDPLKGLVELKLRDQEGYNEATKLFNGKTMEKIEADWESNGRVFLRQVDPLPMSVSAIMPSGLIPIRK